MQVNDRIIKVMNKYIYFGSEVNSEEKVVDYAVYIYMVPTSRNEFHVTNSTELSPS
jgi:hypothetical protein